MKNLLLFAGSALLLSACSPSLSHDQEAVERYLAKTLDDPASYQATHWGAWQSWRKMDADTLAAKHEMLLWQKDAGHAQSYIDSCHDLSAFHDLDTLTVGRLRRSGMAAARRADKRLEVIDRLKASKDTTRIGSAVWHSFRAKNKVGGLVLDSAKFLVAKTGAVTVIDKTTPAY